METQDSEIQTVQAEVDTAIETEVVAPVADEVATEAPAQEEAAV